MNGQQQHENDVHKVVRLWTHAEAVKAVPYFRAILTSGREYWLEARSAQLRLQRLQSEASRSRESVLRRDEITADAKVARTRFEEALNELEAVSVRCMDIVRGLSFIPFVRNEQLAWFVFDLFSAEGLVAWRFDSDPLTIRRNLGGRMDSMSSSKLPAKLVDFVMSDAREQRT